MVGASVAVLLVSSGVPYAGAAAAPGSTLLVSRNNDGTPASLGGDQSAISADGNAVAFLSTGWLDTTINPGPIENVFVRDIARNRTVLISRGRFVRPSSTGLAAAPAAAPLPTVDVPADRASEQPSISADGRFVMFLTRASNIVFEDASTDTSMVIADRDPDGDGDFDENLPGGNVRDYRYMLVPDDATDIVRHGRLAANASRIVWSGGSDSESVFTAAVNLPAGEVGASEHVPVDLGDDRRVFGEFDGAISGDGNVIAMSAFLEADCDCSSIRAIIATDMRTRTSTRVDLDEGGKPVGNSDDVITMRPSVSGDGRVIAFVAELFDRNDNGFPFSRFNEPNVYAVNLDYSKAPNQRVTRSVLASRNNAGQPINGELPGLSGDGRYLAFVTDSPDTHDGEDEPERTFTCIRPEPPIGLVGDRSLRLNAALPPERPQVRTTCQVVVRDLVVDLARDQAKAQRLVGTLASPNRQGNAGNGDTVPDRGSTAPSLSATGGRIAFDSSASNLVDGDANQRDDVFVRTLEPSLRGTAVDFDEVEVEQSLLRTAQIDHVGAGPLLISTVTVGGVNAADFTITGQTCQGATLHQTGSCAVTVQFAPGVSGDRRGQLQVRPRSGRVLTVDLIGTGTDKPIPPRGPEFSVDPASIDFGQRLLLSSGPESAVTVTNNGGTPLQVSSVVPDGLNAPGDYTVASNTCAGVSVAPGASCRVAVRFSPALPGDRRATLKFTDNAAGSPHLVGLQGRAGAPTLEMNPGVTVPSRVVTATGKGFPPGKKVTVTSASASERTVATVGADGTFRASLLVFAEAKAETRTMVATVDGIPALFANAPLLVVFPTVSPAEFVVRG